MIERVLAAKSTVGIAVLVGAFAPFLMGQKLAAQEAEVPPGLPDWAFNIPDKVQPTSWKPGRHGDGARQREGVRSRQARRQSAGLVSRRASHGATGGGGRPGNQVSLRLVPPDVRSGARGIRRPRRDAGGIPDAADGLLQDGDPQGRRPHGSHRGDQVGRGGSRGGRILRRVEAERMGAGQRDRHAAEDVHRHRCPSSLAASRRLQLSHRAPYPRNPGGPVPYRGPRPAFRLHCLRPPGSIAKGEALVKGGESGKTVPARSVTARRSRASARCRGSRACNRSTSRGSSSTCNTARAPGKRRH